VLFFIQETKFLVTIVLLLLFFYLFPESITEIPVLYALYLSEIASNLTFLPCFEFFNS